MRVALDTNVLVYAEGVNGESRKDATRQIILELEAEEIVIPVRALGELFNVLTHKVRWPAMQARHAVLGWYNAYQVADTTPAVLLEAMEVTTAHQFALWDAIMLAAAAQAGCRLLLSEDMHDGFIWRGVTLRNPFVSAGL